MSIDLLSTLLTITAPASSDGRGGVATLNTPADGNFVGYLFDSSGFDGPGVRTSQDDVVEGPGAVFGSFQHGARSFTLEVDLRPDTTGALSMARRDKLYRAFNAMAADGTVAWVETGGSSRFVSFRREQPPRGPDKEGHVLLAGICADPRIYKSGSVTSHATTATNNGTVGSPPTATFTPGATGTVTIASSTTGLSVLITVGTGGVATGSAVTVDFNAKTVTQGGTRKDGAVVFPTSTWWEVVPGSNSWSITGASVSSTSVAFRDAWL